MSGTAVVGALKSAALAIAKAIAGTTFMVLVAKAPQGDPNLRKIQALLAKPAVMCGRFEQAKTLVGLRRPVRSSGRFCVAVEKGVLWTTLLPFPATLRLTKDEIVESRDGQVTKRLSAHQEPAVGIINDLLFSLLQGDLSRLTSGFAIGSTVEDREWKAKLVPNEGGMKRIIGSIDIHGTEFVQEITIHETSGDLTDIAFSGVVTGAAALLPEESRQLELPSGAATRPAGHGR
jgi:hypothetical protein